MGKEGKNQFSETAGKTATVDLGVPRDQVEPGREILATGREGHPLGGGKVRTGTILIWTLRLEGADPRGKKAARTLSGEARPLQQVWTGMFESVSVDRLGRGTGRTSGG